MGYKILHLTLGELRVADILLSNPPKADISTIRTYNAVRSALQLRQSARDLNKLNDKGLDLGVFPVVPTPQGPQTLGLQWEDMLDPDGEILATIRDKGLALFADADAPNEAIERLEAYRELVQSLLCERECSLPDSALKTLNDLIGKKDWTKVTLRNRETGRVEQVVALVSMTQMEIFESLADKVGVAITQKDVPKE